MNNVKNIGKKTIVLLLLIISGCCCSGLNNNLYIPLEKYTKEEQKQLADFLENNNVEIVDKVVMDYSELRERVRVVNGE